MLYGGEARHDHRATHVGSPRTFGAPGQEFRQQQVAERVPANQWQATFREYSLGPEGQLRYDEGHRHGGESGNWPLGRSPGESGR